MKKSFLVLISILAAGLSACHQNPENGGEEIRGTEQSGDTAMDTVSESRSSSGPGAVYNQDSNSNTDRGNSKQGKSANTSNNGGSSHSNNERDSSLSR